MGCSPEAGREHDLLKELKELRQLQFQVRERTAQNGAGEVRQGQQAILNMLVDPMRNGKPLAVLSTVVT